MTDDGDGAEEEKAGAKEALQAEERKEALPVFEIDDFSLATGWERLVRQLEGRLLAWALDRERLPAAGLRVSCELLHRDRSFTLTAQTAATHSEPQSASSSGPLSCPPAAVSPSLYLPSRSDAVRSSSSSLSVDPSRWLGLRSFLLLSPSTSRRVSRNDAASLLSALSVAAAACQCLLPLLVTVGHSRRGELWGRTVTGSDGHRQRESAETVSASSS